MNLFKILKLKFFFSIIYYDIDQKMIFLKKKLKL